MTVYMSGRVEYYGTIRSLAPDDFTINEVDQGREITLRYEEVRKIPADMAAAGPSTESVSILIRS